jgi:hypothetical protein
MAILKKINMAYALCITLLAGVTFSACSDDDLDPFVNLSTSEIAVEYTGLLGTGANASFEVGSDAAWKISYTEDWIKCNHMSGEKGRTTVFLTIDENLTGEDREGIIMIDRGGVTEGILITQKLKVETLSATPAKLAVAKSGLTEKGEEASLYVMTNSDWKITDYPAWAVPEKTEGKRGEFALKLTIPENTTGASRTGEITIEAGDLTTTVEVTQGLFEIKTDGTQVTVDGLGYLPDGSSPEIEVTAATTWTATHDSWIHLNKDAGEPGVEKITLTFDENTNPTKRIGKITFKTPSNTTIDVEVTQASNIVLEDDGKAIGFVYLNDNFSWCDLGLGAGKQSDQVADATQTKSIPIYGTTDDQIKAAAAFATTNYADYNPTGSCFYLALGYLKMGKTNNQTGLVLDGMPTIDESKSTSAELTFKVAPNIHGTNGTIDQFSITVEILEGPGTVNGTTSNKSEPVPHGVTAQNTWKDMSVKLYDISADTKIAIRTEEQGKSGVYRWFLDDVKLVKIAK